MIDKHNHNCLLVENGKSIHNFLIEMGVNYVSDKMSKNDNATAEGCYYISSKGGSTKSNNYKSLILNFPNKEDSLRFDSSFNNNEIPNLDVLSEKLSIHSNGGKGFEWTDGSIALSNRDMDILFSKVKIGTKVVIVGKAKDIHKN